MKPEIAALIDKVTAKTIFEENVFYMITWKHKDDTQNTWKPSEFFEENPFLSSLVAKFEEEMKKTEEDLFKKLEKEEMRRRQRKERDTDKVKIEDEGKNLVWFGSGDERSLPTSKAPQPMVDQVKPDKKMQFTSKDQQNLFHKFNPGVLNHFQSGVASRPTRPKTVSAPATHSNAPGPRIMIEEPEHQPKRADIKKIENQSPNAVPKNAFLVQERRVNPAEQEMRRKKLAVFYDLELREKVFDFKNYGHKVLADLRLIADPMREKKLVSVRHAALFQKLPIED